MQIMEFCQKVGKCAGAYLGEEVTVTVNKITKNNGIVLHSVVAADKGRNISPNIYMDDLFEAYEKGETFKNIMDEFISIYKESRRKEDIDMSFFLDYGRMSGKVLYKVISYEKNKELLLQVPYIMFLDFAIVFYCFVSQQGLGNATVLIYNNHMKMWGITKERLYTDAKRNTQEVLPARIVPIEEMMREIFTQDLMHGFSKEKCGEDVYMPEKEWFDKKAEQMLDSAGIWGGDNMFVLGNQKKLFGAAGMLYSGMLEQFAERLGKDVFILPSSIHEVILIPNDEEQEPEELWKMVCEINATQVEPEEVLTDSVYYFSRKNNKMEKLF